MVVLRHELGICDARSTRQICRIERSADGVDDSSSTNVRPNDRMRGDAFATSATAISRK